MSCVGWYRGGLLIPPNYVIKQTLPIKSITVVVSWYSLEEPVSILLLTVRYLLPVIMSSVFLHVSYNYQRTYVPVYLSSPSELFYTAH